MQDKAETIRRLNQNWIWVDGWMDSSPTSAARLVTFIRTFDFQAIPETFAVYLTADTRYKLTINSRRITIGPSRSTPAVWYYDELDVAPYLVTGQNTIQVDVIRYFPSAKAGLPFVRSHQPGFTLIGSSNKLDLNTGGDGWNAVVHDVVFPMGLEDDVFLHISERVAGSLPTPAEVIKRPIEIRNGEGAPWRLRPRSIPLPEQTSLPPFILRKAESTLGEDSWSDFLSVSKTLTLSPTSKHIVELQAQTYSTAFLRLKLKSKKNTTAKIKITYSEGYEREPRLYPWLRTKDDRLDSTGRLIGPRDEVELVLTPGQESVYEPFWFRTFYVLRLEIQSGDGELELVKLEATQVNYPLDVKAEWNDEGDSLSGQMLDVSVRTMRNCILDGYSDCPFYEQLQYAGDTRFVALFHYLLSGDDRLARQALTLFASSVTPEGLLQSRVPSHVQQIILGFSLYWILMLADHHLFFGDTEFTRSFLPIVDGILEYFDRHIDELGLVSGVESDVWQYIDWTTNWAPGPGQGDKGVPNSGRKSNRHTFFSLLYAYTLKEASKLLSTVGRPGLQKEYQLRADAANQAVRTHCFDGTLFTDSTAEIADINAYSWHCQVFAVLSGAAADPKSLLTATKGKEGIAICSYAMKFYEFRAISMAGLYDDIHPTMFDPWRAMLRNNLSTWAEDDVRQRSDCHAWSAVPIFEWYAEVTGLYPTKPGCGAAIFRPRVNLTPSIKSSMCLGRNVARVGWTTGGNGTVFVRLVLDEAIELRSQLPGGDVVDHGTVQTLELEWRP